MNEKKLSLLKRLINTWNERRGMTAMANVLSGRKPKWYARPLAWVEPLVLFGLIAFTGFWELLRYFAIPLMIVCIFFTMHNMNNQLDRIEAALDKLTHTRIILEWIDEKIQENETE